MSYRIDLGPSEELAHFGVKGMRWGVRKAEPGSPPKSKAEAIDVAQKNTATKEWISSLSKISEPTEAQARKTREENLVKAEEKLLPEGKGTKRQLTPAQKKLLIAGGVGLGAVAVGGAAYYLSRKTGAKSLSIDAKNVLSFAGKPVHPDQYSQLSRFSKQRLWGGRGTGHIQPSSFARPEFELPAGTTFFRMSKAAESEFSGATYSMSSIEDWHRYMNVHRGHDFSPDRDLYQISWTSKTPVKVPDLTTTLASFKRAIETETQTEGSWYKGAKYTDSDILEEYNRLSGSGWKSSLGKRFIDDLKSKGYGAMVDEMDAGVVGQAPLVFFGNENASPKTSTKVSKNMIKEAEKMVREIDNPPGRKF